MKSIENLLKYGIDSNLASKIISKGLNISSLRSLNKGNLKNDFEFEDYEIAQINDALIRKPIQEDVLVEILLIIIRYQLIYFHYVHDKKLANRNKFSES